MHKKDGKKNKKRGWKRKRSGKALAAAALLLGAAILFSCGFAKTSQYAGGGRGYLRSATYYSDDWVINFWNSESCHMEEELAQIAADGFNSIILAVPWREFQPQTRPISYEDYAWAKLDRVMEMAAAQDLGVILRVGYTWDYAGSDNILTRYERLLYDEEIRSAWLSYAARLYERASAHENFCGGFLTWEDFWNFTENCAGYGNGITGRKMAKQVGYTAYARERYSLKELSAFYGTDFSDYSEIYLPEKESYARKVLFEFYDAFLQKLLKETQAVFPDLSMEVRLDTDAVKKADGSLEGVPHWNTFGCGDASYTGIMYSVPMGFANAGEKVTAEEALKKAPVLLNQVRAYNGNKPVYVDQFLFTDNTVGFEQNAQLEESEKTAYLNGMGEIFRKYTMGYGIWTYRDYGDNKLYNPQFALGLRGWKSFGGSYVAEGDEGKEAVLPSGSRISQDIRSRATGASGNDAYVRFTLEGRDGAVVTVRAGGRSQTAAAGERRTVEMKFEDCSAEELSISCTGGGTAMVDNVKVYTYITEGDLYRMDGSQDHCMEAVRQLNRTLGASQADNS